jgi:hypothetical protein
MKKKIIFEDNIKNEFHDINDFKDDEIEGLLLIDFKIYRRNILVEYLNK